MEKESNQLFISAEIFRWSFIEIDQAQEFPQNGREMSNKHPWKYNHYRIIKNLERCPFCSHIPFLMRSLEQILFLIKLKWKAPLLHWAIGPNPKLAKPCLKMELWKIKGNGGKSLEKGNTWRVIGEEKRRRNNRNFVLKLESWIQISQWKKNYFVIQMMMLVN